MQTVDIERLGSDLACGVTLVDVREPREYAAGHVPGARSIPMGQLPGRLAELERGEPVYLICATGNRSAAMTDLLASAGYDAHNVSGGTRAWTESGRPLERRPRVSELQVLTLETPSLGDRSYLVHDGEVAVAIDPQRDIDRVLDLLAEHRVRLTDVFETHVHNDYVTGGLALAEHTGATYHVNAEDPVAFDRSPISPGDVVAAGERIRLRAIHTPGHTFTHLSYALADGERQVGVFTGGSLLYGATGRPDLLGEEHTDELVHLQHASAHRLTEALPDEAEVWPTHGFGSFCASGGPGEQQDESTIGRERKDNPVLTQDADTWVRETLAGLDVWPAYYTRMAPKNLAGPGAPDLSPPESADKDELRGRIDAGEWVVDLRSRVAFAAGHAPGTLNFGLDGSFVTYLGWMLEWGTPLTLLGESAEQVAEAQRELVRIGIDRPEAAATGGPGDWSDREPGSFPRASFADLADVRHHRPVVVLDVRRASEYAEDHIDGAVNIPIHEIPGRLGEVPAGEVWVHCESGYRASIAASFLAAAGHPVVAVDDFYDGVAETSLATTAA